MLGDWLERLFTTCPVHLRDMGCLREMLGIRRRRRLYRDAWQPHCDRSRGVILDAIQRCAQRRHAVLLGTGWLHDVPLTELAAAFEVVTLVDLFHPLSVRRHARRHRNVRVVAADVTGVLEQVWRCGFERGPLPQSRPPLDTWAGGADLTVSLNLLSQLPCMPERYLLQFRSHTSGEILDWGRALIRAHLDYLEALPGVVALISDFEVLPTGKNTLYGIELPYAGESWEWSLVPGRETLRVVGVVDLHEGRGNGM